MIKKFLGFLIVLVAAGGLVLFLSKDWLARRVFASAVEALMGFRAEIRGLRLDPAKGVIHLEGLVLFNPPDQGFRGEFFGDAPEIYLEMDLPALMRKEKVHFRELRLDVSELHVEKNAAGVSNLSLLNPVKKSPRKMEAGGTGKKMPFRLDRFVLTLRRVSYHDRSGIVPKKLAVDMHVDREVFEGITDAKSIVQIIVMKVVSSTPFGNLGVNVVEIQNQLKDRVRTAREVGEKIYHEARGDVLATETTRVGRQILGEGSKTLGQAGGAAKEEITNLWEMARSKFESESSQ